MSDRRTRFATDRLAAAELRGTLDAAAYVTPWPRRVHVPATFLLREPAGPRDREILFGDRLEIIEDREGWSFGRASKDGYCGWVESAALGPDLAPTHVVGLRHAHLYPTPDIKTPPVARLPFRASVAVRGRQGRWASTPGGWIWAEHLRARDDHWRDPVMVAELFLGTPYLWAGNTGDGIDCSGLVQVACLACGLPCPGDSDQQEAALGEPLAEGARLRRGDLLFWRSHVAWVVDFETILHANAHAMAVTYEPLVPAIERIAGQGDGAVTSRRRLSTVRRGGCSS